MSVYFERPTLNRIILILEDPTYGLHNFPQFNYLVWIYAFTRGDKASNGSHLSLMPNSLGLAFDCVGLIESHYDRLRGSTDRPVSYTGETKNQDLLHNGSYFPARCLEVSRRPIEICRHSLAQQQPMPLRSPLMILFVAAQRVHPMCCTRNELLLMG